MSKYPSDWLSKPLGKVYPKIVVGYVGNVNDHYCRAEEGVPFYRTLNIRDGYFRHSEHLYVTHEFNEKNKKSQITNNDILIARVGANLGMVCKANGISGLANMANAIIIKTNDVNSADADFYTSFLLSPMGKNQIYSGAAGGAQGVFNTKLTQEIIVPVPPLPEQRKIAQILSTWDRGIATTEKLIDASKQQKKALMQQLLTGKKRLVDPETGKAFEGDWQEVKLSKLFARVTEKNKGQSTNVVTISAQHGLIRQEEFFKKSIASETLDNYFILRKGQFAYNKSYSNGYPMGAIKRLNRYDDAVVTSLYICFEIKNSAHTSSCFMEQYFESGLLNRGLTKVAAEGGRAHGLLNVKPTDFMGLALVVPEIKEQQRIASVLTAADKEIELLAAKLAHLKQEKKALMQQLLTGKRRVMVAETEAA
ncbi:restriction endonuclease subunit S [Photobacterium damselae subsp. damselae]|uniref:restriction endonuclease subunit S n=1 Tax=Photobacterium damselae TaxID=38293 RepID=UPI0015931AF5|nr:restriction endonuclease subunit S [Photobacterium damselae]NVH52938.1 restriction endonuclease subunit S [Photobacterium damselae subsp. damselae]NVO80705.1 restriction endonuclease subunit S [Photobacterium damselae subsp. damselae]